MVLDLQKLLDKLLVRDLHVTSYRQILFEPSTNVEDHKISTKVDNHVNHFSDAGVMALDLQKIYLIISLSGFYFDTLWPNVSSFFSQMVKTTVPRLSSITIGMA